jgi:hypothetical protein
MEENYALTRLYHPTGAQVSIPLSLAAELTIEQGSMLLRSLDNLLAAGWFVNLPGIEQGENVAEIGFVARREKYNQNDGTTTPIVDLYENKAPERGGAFKLLHRYLNTPDDISEFEAATGIKLASIPLYNGDNAIERGKGKDNLVVTLPRPAKLVWKQNPQWEGDNDKKHPKRIFIRWFDARLAAGATANSPAADPVTGEIPGAPEPEYLVGSKPLADAILARTGLKPAAFMPILSKSNLKKITLSKALALIEANLTQ